MANILVAKNYQVSDHTQWYNNRSHETDLADNYLKMQNLLVGSANKYLQQVDDIIVHTGELLSIRDVFRDHYYKIHELWEQGHNILYCDLDVLFLQPTDVFGSTSFFSMFNYTQPRSTVDSHYNLSIPNFFNCGIRYYPAEMRSSAWQLGHQMIADWNPNRWDAEQIVYNAMMWHQSELVSDFYKPELAFQVLGPADTGEYSEFNKMKMSNAKLAHFHGSRGSSNRLQLMQEISLTC